jgi:hypothetical protein
MRPTIPGGTGPTPDVHGKPASGSASLSDAGSADDPVMRDALRLVEAFLAIEDRAARNALITLAEGLVSYDWLRKVQRR